MTVARLRVLSAGPLVSIQDAGRPGHLRHGVSPSGPMDRIAHAVANVAIGNPPGAAAIEISIGGVHIESDADLTVGIAGGTFDVRVDGDGLDSWAVRTLRAGERLTVRPGRAGNWASLAVAGEIRSPRWLGSASTHVSSGFGGGVVSAGQVIEVGEPRSRPDLDGPLDAPVSGTEITDVRVVIGPQDHRFVATALDQLAASSFRATAAFDRMGMRLDGPSLELIDALRIPSEAVLGGSVQVDGDGVATILLADHQTAGGYPKIATVIDPDIDRVAQLRPGAPLRFRPVTPDEAIDASRRHRVVVTSLLATSARTDRTLEQRLRRHNLVAGVVDSGASGSETEAERNEDPRPVEPEA